MAPLRLIASFPSVADRSLMIDLRIEYLQTLGPANTERDRVAWGRV